MIMTMTAFGKLGLQRLLRRRLAWLAAGLGLSLLGLVAAVALLGLSGWFITASALAGLGLIVGLDIFTPGAGIRLAAITRTLSRYGERLTTHEATFRLLADLRLDLFGRLLAHPNRHIATLRRGDTLQRLTRDVDALDQLFIGVIGPSISALLISLLAFSLLTLLDWRLALLSVGTLLIAGPLISGLIQRQARTPSRVSVELLPRLRVVAGDGIDGINELRALDRTGAQGQRLQQISVELAGTQQRLGMLDARGQGAMTLITLVASWMALVIGLGLFLDGLINAPVLGLMVLGMLGLGEAWQALPGAWRRLSQCQAAAERLLPLVSPPPDRSLPRQTAAWPEKPDIHFSRVDFRYARHSPPVLEGFDLSIAAGEALVISGPSGIGKTTLARLLLGGVPLDQLSFDDKQGRIAYLPQRVVLFADTVAANLRLADPDASDQQLWEVLERVGLATLVDEMPVGLESWVEEYGRNLSGGQQRRLAVARLMLSDPDLVILDEPTASLDRQTADQLMSQLRAWLKQRTALIISHDPRLVADRRLVLVADAEGRLQTRTMASHP
jgi:ATP-binding cassette, subfamily C, bacterial CydC